MGGNNYSVDIGEISKNSQKTIVTMQLRDEVSLKKVVVDRGDE